MKKISTFVLSICILILASSCQKREFVIESDILSCIKTKPLSFEVVENISRPELDSDYIYKLLKEKKSIAQIGKILGKDPSTILDIAERLQDKYGEKLFLTREEYNKDKQKVDQDELISLVRNGESVKNIAKKFDSAQSTVYNLIRKLKRKQKL